MIRSASSPSLSLTHKLDSEKCIPPRTCMSISLSQNQAPVTSIAVHSSVGSLFRTAPVKSQNSEGGRRSAECECEPISASPRMRRVHSEASLHSMNRHISKSSTESMFPTTLSERGSRSEMSYDSEGEYPFRTQGRVSKSGSYYSSRLSRQSSEVSKIVKDIPSPIVSPNDGFFRDDGLHFFCSNGTLTDISSTEFLHQDLSVHPETDSLDPTISQSTLSTRTDFPDETILGIAGDHSIRDQTADDFTRSSFHFSKSHSNPYLNPSDTCVVLNDRNYDDQLHFGSSDGSGNGRGGGGKCKTKTGPSGNMDSDSTDSYYRRALTLNPAHSLLLRNYARFLYEVRKDWVRAEEYYERAILANPGDGEVLAQYAKLIWESHNDQERASSYFDQAIKSSPENCYVLAAYASFLWTSESADGTSESEIKVDEDGICDSVNTCPYSPKAFNPNIDPMQC